MMQRDPDDPAWRVWRRRVFATLLLAALVIGLFLSFRPTTFDDQEVATDEEPTQTPKAERRNDRKNAEDDGGDGDDGDDGRKQDVEEEPTEGLTDEEAEELIAAARDPEATTVQVLDAGGGSSATTAVQEALTDLGYDVVAVNTSRIDYPVTTVLYTEGNDAEAEALRARDERFAEIEPNERLSTGVDIHIVVGPDWGD